MLILSEARKKQKVTHAFAYRWDPEVRQCIQAVLKSKSTAVKHPAQQIPQWLQTILQQKFQTATPFPGDRLVIREAAGGKGHGIFALAPLKMGTRIGAFRGPVFFDPLALVTDDRTFAVEVLPGTTFSVQGDSWAGLFNHCWSWPASLPAEQQPRWGLFFANVALDDELVLYATRDIASGEELCFDYGLNYWVNSPTKPLWDLSRAPPDLLNALRVNGELSLFRLASAVRVFGNKWLESETGESCPRLMAAPLMLAPEGFGRINISSSSTASH